MNDLAEPFKSSLYKYAINMEHRINTGKCQAEPEVDIEK